MGAFKFGALVQQTASTATAAGTTTLVNNSKTYQRFTGTLAQTVQLPDATTMVVGMIFIIQNRSSGIITVNDGSAGLLGTIAAGGDRTFQLYNIGSTAGVWDVSLATSAVGNVYPTVFAGSSAELTTAITTVASGGVIALYQAFSVTSLYTIPAGVLLISRMAGTALTIGSGGGLILASGAKMRDVYLTTANTSGDMLLMSGSYCTIRDCQFTIPTSSTGNCIKVTGSTNKIYNCSFVGVAGEVATGINYSSGLNNSDTDSIFFP